MTYEVWNPRKGPQSPAMRWIKRKLRDFGALLLVLTLFFIIALVVFGPFIFWAVIAASVAKVSGLI